MAYLLQFVKYVLRSKTPFIYLFKSTDSYFTGFIWPLKCGSAQL